MQRPISLSLIFIAACGVSEPETTRSAAARQTPLVSPAELTAVVRDDTDFALEALRRLDPAAPNTIYSPHSISTAMAMLWAGARGSSEAAIAEALHFSRPQAALHPVFNHLDRQLSARSATVDDADVLTLRVVNDLWLQRGFTVLPDYLDTLAAHYGAGVRRVDFAADAGDVINGWIADQTEDRIPALFQPGSLGASTRLVLTNAIYFEADWLHAFDDARTAPAPFHLPSGSAISVDFMHVESSFPTSITDARVAVELPYAGEELALLVIMPTDLDALLASITAADVDAIVASLADAPLDLSLPKWTHRTRVSLVEPLSEMGMAPLFSGDVDLSGIDGARDLEVAQMVHEAVIEVSEQGTIAAAATGVELAISVPAPPVAVSLDKPFLYLLRDRKTGAILFAGRLTDPRS